MTVKEIKQYFAKRTEIDVLDFQIRQAYPEDYVSDVVVGSYRQPVTIKGYGSTHIPALSKRKAKLEDECRQVEQFIECIDDSLVRMAVSLRYINGLGWRQVAESIGGNNTEDSIRKTCVRFFDKI